MTTQPEAGGRASTRILGLPDLLERLEAHRAAGERIVFTNGCFDLIHAGHVTLLEQAAEQGERLVVGLNTDASVVRLKGSTRPLVAQEARALVVASLRPVDYVVFFDEDTPAELIQALRPDVLVKGDDYALDEVVGRDTVEASGGKVVRVPLVPGFSTTSVVERLRGESPD